jgi:aminoglycoside phosphotransferase (APT) family kinase protein
VLVWPLVSRAPLHPDEVVVDVELARRLLVAQFPQWHDLPLRPVTSTGTDCVVFALGDRLGLRFPRVDWAVAQIDHEATWLPRLAPHLPVELPEPVAQGVSGEGYPWPWLVFRWIDGDDALDAAVDGPRLADDVAGFVSALHRVDPAGAPVATAGQRGGPLDAHDAQAREAFELLRDEIDHDRVLALWRGALAVPPWQGPGVWLHGDLLPGNLIVRDGALHGVIDWAASGVGDPACDLMIAWSMSDQARDRFRASLGADDATWRRGIGWTLWQAAVFIPYYRDTIPQAVAAARRRLHVASTDS